MVTVETTLRDIANELNLSAVTVSRSLRHDTGINPTTRARVHEAARRLGYKGRPGRPRREKEESVKNRILGLLVRHRSLDVLPGDNNLVKMMAGIMSVADENGLHLKVHPLSPQEAQDMDGDESLVPPMIQENVCQAIIAHGDQDERTLDFLSRRLPVVSIGRIYRNLHIDSAVADNVEGVHTLVTHLVELGHRQLAWVAPYYSATFMEARQAGFMQGCCAHDLTISSHSLLTKSSYDGDGIKPEALLTAVRSGVTAFVCGNDLVSWNVIRALEVSGLKVPSDVSVTGFDASIPTEWGRTPTSIDPNFVEIGKAAAQLALQRTANPRNEPRIVSVRGKLVIGDTTAPRKNLRR